MMAPVIAAQGTKPNARRLLRALLTSDANIIPEPAQGILRVQLPGLGSDACDRMLATSGFQTDALPSGVEQ